MLDMIIRCGGRDKTDFVFFNTDLEYRATLEHLDNLERKYDIKIIRCKPVKPIPVCVKEYGVPFISKNVSRKIYYLQRHGFQFEGGTFQQLMDKYRNVKDALSWWTNATLHIDNRFAIARNKLLREFMMEYPPDFSISDKCCTYAKKRVSAEFEKHKAYDLKCIGVRKSEGGIRSTSYKTCFTEHDDATSQFRPVWWFRDIDKDEYCKHYGVVHSRCYTKYGMRRTGCCGCPFAIDFDENLERMKKYEPQLYKAAVNIFGKSYEYTRQYRKFRDEMKRKEKENESR